MKNTVHSKLSWSFSNSSQTSNKPYQPQKCSMCVHECVCTHALCGPAGPDCMSCWEMKSQWIVHTVQCSPVDVGAVSTQIMKDTHTHTPSLFPGDHLSSSFWRLFFYELNNITSQASVWHCVHFCLSASLCVCVNGRHDFGGNYISITLQRLTKTEMEQANACVCVCVDRQIQKVKWWTN